MALGRARDTGRIALAADELIDRPLGAVQGRIDALDGLLKLAVFLRPGRRLPKRGLKTRAPGLQRLALADLRAAIPRLGQRGLVGTLVRGEFPNTRCGGVAADAARAHWSRRRRKAKRARILLRHLACAEHLLERESAAIPRHPRACVGSARDTTGRVSGRGLTQ